MIVFQCFVYNKCWTYFLRRFFYFGYIYYSWPFNSTGLNFMGPLIPRFPSINTDNTIQSVVGWIQGCRTSDLEGWLWNLSMDFGIGVGPETNFPWIPSDDCIHKQFNFLLVVLSDILENTANGIVAYVLESCHYRYYW